MKPLELSQEQKEKLILMCKALFPEYDIFEIEKDGYLLFVNKKCPAIHWFEFCMTHLRKALKVHYDDLYRTSIGISQDVHPIDYLYEQYLKLKK